MRIGLVLGSGMEGLVKEGEALEVKTPFGGVRVATAKLSGEEVAILPRHGCMHAAPPHRVEYRANVSALSKLGVERVLATGAVGSLREELRPGSVVVVDDFIDLSRSRPSSLFEGPRVVHVDMTEPFCPELREALINASQRAGLKTWSRGVYVCTEGPRFETPAEIRAFKALGGDVVGMTIATEATLAREAGLCYAALCLVTNMAAGLQRIVSAEEVGEVLKGLRDRVFKALEDAVRMVPAQRGCACLQRSGRKDQVTYSSPPPANTH